MHLKDRPLSGSGESGVNVGQWVFPDAGCHLLPPSNLSARLAQSAASSAETMGLFNRFKSGVHGAELRIFRGLVNISAGISTQNQCYVDWNFHVVLGVSVPELALKMTSRAPFKQDDIMRAIRGATRGGLRIKSVEVSLLNGTIVITAQEPDGAPARSLNPWDKEFNDD
jgi:hypothetical protein